MQMLEDHEPISTITYPESDREKWKSGAEKFQHFFASLGGENTIGLDHQDFGVIEAFFLEEKPLLFLHQMSDRARKEFVNSGFFVEGSYVYNQALVKTLLQEEPGLKEELESEEPKVAMKKLSAADHTDFAFSRGILLGIPRSAVEDFVRYQDDMKRNENMPKKIIDVYTVKWGEWRDEPDARAFEEKLSAAFEQSGILEVLDPRQFKTADGMDIRV
ncbi:MAG: hypothetical protein PHV93_00140 [Candidatus Pacebacteria bacterium]|nr:hypothetical protein [Candidatus Paceibacterota bacterium]